MTKPPESITVVPANQASWEDLVAVLGKARCHGSACYCQRFKIWSRDWPLVGEEECARRLRQQTNCGNPEAKETSGLLAYVDSEAAAWCNIEPRPAYLTYQFSRIPWAGRDEDETDDSIWLASCFIVRKEFRGQGLTYHLAKAAVEFARRRGARALEGFSIITEPGKTITWGELHVGSRNIFAEAGLEQVSHPTKRRVIMRFDF